MARDLTSISTEELLELASGPSDDEELAHAVAELVTRYKDLVYDRALRVTGGNRALADEVFQETFLRLFSWLQGRRGQAPLHSFAKLLTVFVKRTAIDVVRKENRGPRKVPLEEASSVAASSGDPDWETKAYALDLLESLDPRSRQVIEYTYFFGLSAMEIARKMNLTPSNVRVLRFRALQAMRLRREQDAMADSLEPL